MTWKFKTRRVNGGAEEEGGRGSRNPGATCERDGSVRPETLDKRRVVDSHSCPVTSISGEVCQESP